jgi:hypothetical protein
VQFVAHLIYLLDQWKYAVIAGSIVAMVALPLLLALFTRDRQRKGGRAGIGVGCGFLLGFPLVFGLAFFGSGISTRLIHRYGVDGEALVTGQFDTDTMYNDQQVYGYNVLIRSKDGRTVETSFRTDSFNVWPPRNAVTYPATGARFTARYLPDHPTDFIILSDDNSQWARGVRCGELEGKMSEASSKAGFAGGDPKYRQQYRDAVAAARAAGCSVVSQD